REEWCGLVRKHAVHDHASARQVLLKAGQHGLILTFQRLVGLLSAVELPREAVEQCAVSFRSPRVDEVQLRRFRDCEDALGEEPVEHADFDAHAVLWHHPQQEITLGGAACRARSRAFPEARPRQLVDWTDHESVIVLCARVYREGRRNAPSFVSAQGRTAIAPVSSLSPMPLAARTSRSRMASQRSSCGTSCTRICWHPALSSVRRLA